MPVQVIARRTGASGRVPANFSVRTVGIVGTSRGKPTTVTNEAVVMGASSGTTGSGNIDALANTDVRSVSRIAVVTGSTNELYVRGSDYVLTGDTIDWRNAALVNPPSLDALAIAATTGGSWDSAGTLRVVVTVSDAGGTGETTPSNVQSITIATGNTVSVQWGKVPFAVGYKLYVKDPNDAVYRQLAVVLGSDTVTYTLTGGTGAGSQPQTENTAHRRPGNGSTYYVTYSHATFSYTKKLYTNYSDVEADHGVGSNLTNAARLAMVDNGATNLYLCAVSAETNSAYQAAVDQLKAVRANLVVALKDSTAVDQYLKAHAEERSMDAVGKERYAVVACPSGYTVGDAATEDTAVYWVKSFTNSRRVIAAIPNLNAYYVNSWQGTDGSHTDGPYEVARHFYAAAVAGRIASLEDVATPLTSSQIYGFTWPESLNLWDDAEVKNLFEAAGGTYVMEEFGNHIVYHGITCCIDTIEDQELSVGAAEDDMRVRLRDAVSSYRGKARKVTVNRLRAIANTCRTVLGAMIKDELISSHGDIEVTQDIDDPTLVWVRFEYYPVYPMNQIIFEYGYSLAPAA